TSSAGSGAYTAGVFLDTVVNPDVAGQTAPDAVDLSPSATLLPGGGTIMIAVGTIAAANGIDTYTFNAQQGQAISIATGLTPGETSAGVSFGIYGPDGTALAFGVNETNFAHQIVRDFVTPTAGSYTVKVLGGEPTSYALAVTVGAGFRDAGEPDTS